MKLNPDCIRDILFTVEENTSFYNDMEYTEDNPQIYPKLMSYSIDEILYHIKQCEKSYLIDKVLWYSEGCTITDLTPNGHQFLSNIRSDSAWNKTKEISKNIGSSSLDALKQIATSVISELIKAQFLP